MPVGEWPEVREYSLADGLNGDPRRPLSERATRGFLDRLRRSSLRYPAAFGQALEKHLAVMRARSDTFS